MGFLQGVVADVIAAVVAAGVLGALGWLGAGLWLPPWSPGWVRPWGRDPWPVRGEGLGALASVERVTDGQPKFEAGHLVPDRAGHGVKVRIKIG